MNVYDFDKTIHRGDSTAEFFKWCMLHRPMTLLVLPRVAFWGILYGLHIVKRDTFKGKFYHFLKYLRDPYGDTKLFWDKEEKKIYKWYLEQKREDDLIISASPEFLIGEIAERLGVKYMASPVDIRGRGLLGDNCRDKEKVRRFYEAYPDGVIDEFYSDSYADTPLAKIAKKAYMVSKKTGLPSPWIFK